MDEKLAYSAKARHPGKTKYRCGMKQQDDAEATGEVDDLLSSVGLGHGRRKTLAGSWQNGERMTKTTRACQKTLHGPSAVHGDEGTQSDKAAKRVEQVRAPGWLHCAWLRHGFSTRAGGVSTIYDSGGGNGSLNLGWTQQDDAANVAENRRRFMAEIAGGPAQAVTLRQFHSAMLRTVETEDLAHPARLRTADGRAVLRGDGMMTDVPGVFLGIQTSDCVPVLVADFADLIHLLDSDAVDAITSDQTILIGLMANAPDPAAYRIAGKTFTIEPYGIAVPQNQSHWRNALNQALMEVWEKGQWQSIVDSWFGPGTTYAHRVDFHPPIYPRLGAAWAARWPPSPTGEALRHLATAPWRLASGLRTGTRMEAWQSGRSHWF